MDIAVIGGGASGLMASIIASKNGAKVTIYEKSNRIGKKILATGNGRCNFTNLNMSIDRFHSNNLKIVNEVLESFNMEKTLSFFEKLGIHPYIGDDGKVYPNSLQSSSILDVLNYEIDKLNIDVICDFEILELRKNKDKFSIIGYDKIYNADKVILCTGGMASPQLGSDGKGLYISKLLGHDIIDPFPALVQLKLKGNYFKKISGVRFDGSVKSFTDSEVIREEIGEILFTDYGISGPPILQISRESLEVLYKNKKVYIEIDMFFGLSKFELYDILKQRFKNVEHKDLENGLIGFIHKKLISVILEEAKLEKSKMCKTLNKKDIYKLIDIMKSWKFEVTGHNTWQNAQVSAGGVDFKSIKNKTLESSKVKGLYFAGEILDVDGDCGGFNLQWAWSSGYTTGYFSSKK